jgi:hypothetical protein
MASDASNLLVLVHVPDSGGVIVGSGDEDGVLGPIQVFGILKTCNTVQVSFEGVNFVTTSTPVPFEFESLAIHVFPRTSSEF